MKKKTAQGRAESNRCYGSQSAVSYPLDHSPVLPVPKYKDVNQYRRSDEKQYVLAKSVPLVMISHREKRYEHDDRVQNSCDNSYCHHHMRYCSSAKFVRIISACCVKVKP